MSPLSCCARVICCATPPRVRSDRRRPFALSLQPTTPVPHGLKIKPYLASLPHAPCYCTPTRHTAGQPPGAPRTSVHTRARKCVSKIACLFIARAPYVIVIACIDEGGSRTTGGCGKPGRHNRLAVEKRIAERLPKGLMTTDSPNQTAGLNLGRGGFDF